MTDRTHVGWRVVLDDEPQAMCMTQEEAIKRTADTTGLHPEFITEQWRKGRTVIDADGRVWELVEVTSHPNDYGEQDPPAFRFEGVDEAAAQPPSMEKMRMLVELVEAENVAWEDLLGFVVALDQIDAQHKAGEDLGDGTEVICDDHDIADSLGASVLESAVMWAPRIVESMKGT